MPLPTTTAPAMTGKLPVPPAATVLPAGATAAVRTEASRDDAIKQREYADKMEAMNSRLEDPLFRDWNRSWGNAMAPAWFEIQGRQARIDEIAKRYKEYYPEWSEEKAATKAAADVDATAAWREAVNPMHGSGSWSPSAYPSSQDYRKQLRQLIPR